MLLHFQNVYFFTSQHFVTAVTNMLIDIAVLEFTCSQSPYSMKGLILGFFFSIKAFIQAGSVCFSLHIIWAILAFQILELWDWLLPHEYCYRFAGVGSFFICC